MSKHDAGKKSQTNGDDVDKLEDSDLVDAESPELDETFWQEAIFVPGPQHHMTLRIDADVLELFRAPGPGDQRCMNAGLRRYREAQRRRPS